MNFTKFEVPYAVDTRFSKKVAYFSMEFAVHQPLKIYSGGLGFLAGSHVRSAYELRQNTIFIGILWKYGYYDQARNQDQSLQVTWVEKQYPFLQDTGIKFQINIPMTILSRVKAFYLAPETFNGAPLFPCSARTFLKTDYVSQTISHRFIRRQSGYSKVAQFILLGVGGFATLVGSTPEFFSRNSSTTSMMAWASGAHYRFLISTRSLIKTSQR